MAVHINSLYLVGVVVIWALLYHFVYRLALILREPSLICWGVGPLGVTAISLRKPSPAVMVSQFIYAGLAMACAVYFTLFVAQPTPVRGLPMTGTAILAAVGGPVALMTLVTGLAQTRQRLHPLWGEAHVLIAVQRARALGALLIFTTLGRTFLHDRFNATPTEFLQTLRG